jgi:hypothetical protein
MRAILPLHLSGIHQSQEALVDQGGGLERVITTLVLHVSARHPTELRVHERSQFRERGIVALAPRP